MPRRKKSELVALVDRLNRVTGSPSEPYTRNTDGTNQANAGAYLLSGAYGGYLLHRMVEGGGERDVLQCGYCSVGALYDLIDAYLRGIYDAQKEINK